MFLNWLRKWAGRSVISVSRQSGTYRPQLEGLEERTVPSTIFTVNTFTDNGTSQAGVGSGTSGDLRYCVAQANADTSVGLGGTVFIQFAQSGQTIQLSSTLGTLTLHNPQGEQIEIDGPTGAPSGVTVSGGGSGSNFSVFTNDSNVVITALTITNGFTTGNGGGILADATLSVTNCTLTGNSANVGGGIENTSQTTVSNCTFTNNLANYGAALHNADAKLTVTNSTLDANTAMFDAGGIGNSSGVGTVTVINCTITANSAATEGGGLDNYSTLSVTNSTLSGNSSASGSINTANGGKSNLVNTIVANSVAGGDLTIDLGNGSAYSGSNDLIDDGTQLSSFSSSVSGNPMLGTLANYGGPTQTLDLLQGSPAIDAGTATGAPSTDQRGYSRFAAVDIGAFEFQSGTLTSALVVTTGVLSPSVGGAPSTISAPGLSLGPSATYAPIILSTTPATGYAQLLIDGSVSIAGTLTLQFGYSPNVGDKFDIIEYSGTLTGTFNNLPEGTQFTVNNHTFVIHYAATLTASQLRPNVMVFLQQAVEITCLTSPNPPPPSTNSVFATGPDAGGGPDVTIFDGNGNQLAKVHPYDDGSFTGSPANDVFTGGVHVGVGDLTGDGSVDVVCTPGGGGGPDVKVYNTAGKLVAHIQPVIDGFPPLMFFGGLNVACGSVISGSGRDQIIIATASIVAEVLVFDYAGTTDADGLLEFTEVDHFIPFGTSASPFGGGARVAVADVTGSGVGAIVVAAGPGGGPDVKSYMANGTPIQEFKAGPESYNFGLYVGAGYLNGFGAGNADIVVGSGTGTSALISVFAATSTGQPQTPLYTTASMGVAFPPSSFQNGVRLAVVDPDNNGMGEIVSTLGPGGDPKVHFLNGQTLQDIGDLTPVDPNFTGGLFISANG